MSASLKQEKQFEKKLKQQEWALTVVGLAMYKTTQKWHDKH